MRYAGRIATPPLTVRMQEDAERVLITIAANLMPLRDTERVDPFGAAGGLRWAVPVCGQ